MNTSSGFEGESTILPVVSQDYEGENVPASTDSEGDELLMPDMINLESIGTGKSPRLATLERKQYACKTALMKFCAFGMSMASSVSDPVAVFSHGQDYSSYPQLLLNHP